MSAEVLFLGHAADRTGPPIYLLHLLRWLREHGPKVEYEVLLLAGGPLEEEFRALAPTTVVDTYTPPRWWHRGEEALLRHRPELETGWWRARRDRQIRQQLRHIGGHSLVYVSTAASTELARLLPPWRRVQLSHVHELDIGLRYHLPDLERTMLLDGADHIFAASEAVRTNLIEGHGVDAAAITRHYEMVDVLGAPAPLDADTRGAERTAKGLPADGLLVGSSGTLDWRKAVDLFLRVAWTVGHQDRTQPVTFLWVGGDANAVAEAQAQATAAGVGDTVRFVGLQSDPLSWFRLLDVFVLPAREDAFPLVCLEAASVGCPIVCFDNGGMPELVSQGCGFVATYPDVDDFAAKLGLLLDDAEERARAGALGATLVREHHDVSVLAPRLWADIERWLP